MIQAQTFTLTQAAQYIGVSRKTLYNMLHDGRFPVVAVARSKPRRWNVADVDRWLAGGGNAVLTEIETAKAID